jgi:hypothetical protein
MSDEQLSGDATGCPRWNESDELAHIEDSLRSGEVEMQSFLDINGARNFIVKAMNHYQERQAPGWFTDWLDDLYIRLGENWAPITLDELFTLSSLNVDGCWLTPHYAMNGVYKMFDRLGRDTTGIVGF